ncbi:MAG: trypsin-like peptidase domain-containing protein [Myxococcales bacterium]|nr:trypsin-like peptidase domain-containing protein [Myxococcales bacterium]
MDGRDAKRTASGVVVGSELTTSGAQSYVLTNAHVLDTQGAKEPSLVVAVDHGLDSVEYAAEPVAVGKVPEMDLALVKVRGVTLAAAQLASEEELELGDDVVVVAAPFGRSLSLSGGIVSQVDRDPKSRALRMVKTDAPIGYGSSGGGVYSLSTGKLLAIVEGYRTAKVGFAMDQRDFSFEVPMPGETFAAPSSKVRAFLESSGFGRFLSEGTPSAQAALR